MPDVKYMTLLRPGISRRPSTSAFNAETESRVPCDCAAASMRNMSSITEASFACSATSPLFAPRPRLRAGGLGGRGQQVGVLVGAVNGLAAQVALQLGHDGIRLRS